MKLYLIALAVTPLIANANPPASILAEIANYDPAISYRQLGATESSMWSACKMKNIELTGTDPHTKAARTISVKEYSNPNKDQANIILLPPTGGVNSLDTNYAKFFCDCGFRVLLVESWQGDDSVNIDLSSHDVSALRALIATKHVVEFAQLNNRKIGVLGTSVGGLTASLLLGQDSRVLAGAVIASGGNMPEIVARTTEQGAAALRAKRFEKYGFHSIEEYEQKLREAIHYENLDFAEYTGKKPVWMSIGLDDVTVPTKNQLQLKEAWNVTEENIARFSFNHVHTIISTYLFQKAAIASFFERNLRP